LQGSKECAVKSTVNLWSSALHRVEYGRELTVQLVFWWRKQGRTSNYLRKAALLPRNHRQ